MKKKIIAEVIGFDHHQTGDKKKADPTAWSRGLEKKGKIALDFLRASEIFLFYVYRKRPTPFCDTVTAFYIFTRNFAFVLDKILGYKRNPFLYPFNFQNHFVFRNSVIL